MDKKLRELLEQACASCENQACWDKKPWSEWYYEAKRYLTETSGEKTAEEIGQELIRRDLEAQIRIGR